jgi:serine/threonine protein phosphatase PrpC
VTKKQLRLSENAQQVAKYFGVVIEYAVEEASKKLVDLAMALGTMDNTTATVVKLNWNLDFLTQDEIDGKISNPKPK